MPASHDDAGGGGMMAHDCNIHPSAQITNSSVTTDEQVTRPLPSFKQTVHVRAVCTEDDSCLDLMWSERHSVSTKINTAVL